MTPEIILAISSIYTYAEKVGKTPDDVYKEWTKFAYGRFSEKKISTPNLEKVNEDDVNEIYSLYPSRDVQNNNRSTNKGAKTKSIIRGLLAKGKTKEELIAIVSQEVEANNRGKWICDANKFFNNLPEPDTPIQREIELDQTWQ